MEKGYTLFDDVIASCKIGVSKADDVHNGTTHFFDYALTKYEVDAKNCLFIDDNERNCNVAKKLGITTIVFHDPQQIKIDVDNIIKIN
jgi:HAD superfamily hydrolase (TIGR01509 family)